MTNLTLEQIREAVELAEGIEWPTITKRAYGEGSWEEPVDMPDKHFIAALASQLISQVQQIALEKKQPWLWANIITDLRKQGLEVDIPAFLIVACTEFLRGR